MLIKPKINTFLPVAGDVPPVLANWLTYQDSLKELLQKKAGHAHVEVLEQKWELPDWWDQHVLLIKDGDVFHREILMWAKEDPCWYARTVIPKTTYNADEAFFDRLQNQSLGELIFQENQIKRVHMLHYPTDVKSIEYAWLTKWLPSPDKIIWVRLSVFAFKEDFPFYLIEALLPTLERYA